MERKALDKWARKAHAGPPKLQTINGRCYMFYPLPDGWIAVVEDSQGDYIPITQAINLQKAVTYCTMIEPVSVPYEVL